MFQKTYFFREKKRMFLFFMFKNNMFEKKTSCWNRNRKTKRNNTKTVENTGITKWLGILLSSICSGFEYWPIYVHRLFSLPYLNGFDIEFIVNNEPAFLEMDRPNCLRRLEIDQLLAHGPKKTGQSSFSSKWAHSGWAHFWSSPKVNGGW